MGPVLGNTNSQGTSGTRSCKSPSLSVQPDHAEHPWNRKPPCLFSVMWASLNITKLDLSGGRNQIKINTIKKHPLMKNQGLSPGTCDSLDVHFQVGPCSCPATPVIAETRQPSKTVKIGSESWMASYQVLALEVGMAKFLWTAWGGLEPPSRFGCIYVQKQHLDYLR